MAPNLLATQVHLLVLRRRAHQDCQDVPEVLKFRFINENYTNQPFSPVGPRKPRFPLYPRKPGSPAGHRLH